MLKTKSGSRATANLIRQLKIWKENLKLEIMALFMGSKYLDSTQMLSGYFQDAFLILSG